VVVGVDQAGEDDAAFGVDDLGTGGGVDGGTYGGDGRTFNEDLAVGEDGLGIIEGDDKGVLDQHGAHGRVSCGAGIFHTVEKSFPQCGKN
jgi:hypothetical protein